MIKNIRNRRIIEDPFESKAHYTLENSDHLADKSPRSNMTEISFNQSFEEDEFKYFIQDNIEPNKSDINLISEKINGTKAIKCKDFQTINEISLDNNLIN
jgi:hypothetical protein